MAQRGIQSDLRGPPSPRGGSYLPALLCPGPVQGPDALRGCGPGLISHKFLVSLTAGRCRPRGRGGRLLCQQAGAGSNLRPLVGECLLTAVLVSPGQICIFVGETLLFSNWAITADILMVRQAEVASADQAFGPLRAAGDGEGRGGRAGRAW